jgi:UDP-glucose 4-epimerase
MPTVLLTGATGYIGSHTWVALLQAGYDVVGLDNLGNSSAKVVDRIRDLTGRDATFVQADARNAQALDMLFKRHAPEATVHFAALKAVGESEREPLRYWDNNIGALTQVCAAMQRHGCKRMVFSSSATVYGVPEALPLREDAPISAVNVYGQTKLTGERLLDNVARADATWQNAILRYFNPVGAHESGTIGEDPRGVPNNLMPYVAQVAIGRRDTLQVFGGDYNTPDGTGVRDYIHVVDLAEGHVAAVRRLLGHAGSFTVNLGTGRGYSVLDLVNAYARASGRAIPYNVAPRRDGDVASCYADATLAKTLLGWTAKRDLHAMCVDSWRWQSRNPSGFGEPETATAPEATTQR